jgi:hypothetical protein
MSTSTTHLTRRRLAAVASTAVAAALLAGAGPAAAQAHSSARSPGGTRAVLGSTWGTAKEVPGTATLNHGGSAYISSVSCASLGNCSAGGGYTDGSGHSQAFVVSQVSGTWGTAKEVPGTATLNQGGGAAVSSLSCASAGNCSAGGSYTDGSGNAQAFVVSQVHGTWGTAKEVPGTAALSTGGNFITSVSCASAGNCSAAGGYANSQVFVVSQVHGTWGTAKEVPGTAKLNTGDNDWIYSVSCASAGNCRAGGNYATTSEEHPLVVSQTGGTWGKAKGIPIGTGPGAQVSSVSCASAGNCSAGGAYEDAPGSAQAFVIGQIHGTWGTAKVIPGPGSSTFAVINSVSCASAGNCSAAGTYRDSSGHFQALVVSQAGGSWGTAKEVPGTAALNQGGNATINSLSCASAGNCSAGGTYKDSSGHTQAFVVNQTRRIWRKAEELPGTATLNKGGNATINWLSCAPAGNCSAGGYYKDSSGHFQAFIVSQT